MLNLLNLHTAVFRQYQKNIAFSMLHLFHEIGVASSNKVQAFHFSFKTILFINRIFLNTIFK